MSDTKRDDGGKHLGPARTSPYPMSRLAPAHDLIDVAKQIAEADTMLGVTATAKLTVIADQIRALQEAARRVLEETREDLSLHRARCSFERKAGRVYHLYRKPSGELWWSMVSPSEWGASPPSEHAGTYRLEPDQSWTRLEGDVPEEDDRTSIREQVRQLLGENA